MYYRYFESNAAAKGKLIEVLKKQAGERMKEVAKKAARLRRARKNVAEN